RRQQIPAVVGRLEPVRGGRQRLPAATRQWPDRDDRDAGLLGGGRDQRLRSQAWLLGLSGARPSELGAAQKVSCNPNCGPVSGTNARTRISGTPQMKGRESLLEAFHVPPGPVLASETQEVGVPASS